MHTALGVNVHMDLTTDDQHIRYDVHAMSHCHEGLEWQQIYLMALQTNSGLVSA